MDLRAMLERFSRGEIDLEQLLPLIASQRIADIGPAKLDLDRAIRCGIDEAIFAAGKSLPDLLRIVGAVLDRRGRVLITRIKAEQAAALLERFPELRFSEDKRCAAVFGADSQRTAARAAVVTGGSSDREVAVEAAFALEYFGIGHTDFCDVGVAGIERLFMAIEQIRCHDLSIVAAGMEGTLPGVLAGLVRHPVIAVPTSIGYGANFEGLSALLSMLTSCAPGIAVVNIDNGFGAAAVAAKIIRMKS